MATRGLICYFDGTLATAYGDCDASFCYSDCGGPLPIGEALMEGFNTPEKAQALARFGYMLHMADSFEELRVSREKFLDKQENRERALAHISEEGLDEEGIPWSFVTGIPTYELMEAAGRSIWIEGVFAFFTNNGHDAPIWQFKDFGPFWPRFTPIPQTIEEDKLRLRVFEFVREFRDELKAGQLFHARYGKYRTLEDVEAAFEERVPEAWKENPPNPLAPAFTSRCLNVYFKSEVATYLEAQGE